MEKLRSYAEQYGFALSGQMLEQFQGYMELLLKWNMNFNLTAITDPEEICVKHFLDSLMLFNSITLPEGASVIDVGTGAGFPGIPLKIYRPDIQLTLLDSLNKRVRFLQAVSDMLGQDNQCLHGRAEELARQELHRENYALVTARAVAALPILSEYCLPFACRDGFFVALKGYEVEEEVASARRAVEMLGGEIVKVDKLELPLENRRSMIIIKKRSQTPPKYPRIAAKIAKNPL